MSIQPESRFKKKVLKDLREIHGLWVLKTQERSRRGVPDLLICYHGNFIAVELKDTGKKPDPLQAFVLSHIAKCGGISMHATPETWADCLSIIQQIPGLDPVVVEMD